MSKPARPLEFRGGSLSELRGFPIAARREAGFQLYRVQAGHDPNDWKPMNTIGSGVREIRLRGDDGAFRIVYVAKFKDAIHVLHCFQKKTQKTGSPNLALATQRYKDLVQEMSS